MTSQPSWKLMTFYEAGFVSDEPELAWFSPEPHCQQENGEPSWVFERWKADTDTPQKAVSEP